MDQHDMWAALARMPSALGKIYVDVEDDEHEVLYAEARPGVLGLVLVTEAELIVKPEPDPVNRFTVAEIVDNLGDALTALPEVSDAANKLFDLIEDYKGELHPAVMEVLQEICDGLTKLEKEHKQNLVTALEEMK